ncbi:hypothetical protein FQA39_LY11308 [Lamprigera yunnana]|nr:hypothetical protein FQA39_LY11308 [Lamprigera yunnana]
MYMYLKRRNTLRPQLSKIELPWSSTLNTWSIDLGINVINNKKLSYGENVSEKENTENNKSNFINELKKYTTLIVCILLILLLIIIIVLIVMLSDAKQKQTTCGTSSCVSLASTILDNLNTSVDPCNDFYEFACGNYLKDIILPDNLLRKSKLNLTNEIILKQLQLTLEQLPQKLQKPYEFLKKLYLICRNDVLNAKKQIENVKNIFKHLVGWPMVVGTWWNENNFEWMMLTHQLRKLGLPHEYFFSFYVDVDPFNTSRHTLFLHVTPTPPTNDIPYSLLNILEAKRETLDIDINHLLQFRESLLKIQNNKRTDGYNGTLKNLFEKYPQYNWMWYLKSVMNVAEVNINNEQQVYVKSHSAILNLRQLLEETPKRVIANYIFSEVGSWIYQFISVHGQRDQKQCIIDMASRVIANYIFSEVGSWIYQFISVHGQRDQKQCIIDMASSLNLLLNSFYVKKYFAPELRSEVKQLWQSIQSEFENILNTTDWFDERVKTIAVEKLRHMKINIGHPDELVVERNIENYYNRLNVDFRSYLNAMMSISLFKFDEKFSRLHHPVNEYIWSEHSALVITTDVTYIQSHNSLHFPAAYLVNGAFNQKWPQYVNYALIGTVIGHKLTHGFDSTGGKFDKDGNLKKWWNDEETIKEKTLCLAHQYQKYKISVSDLPVNGVLTLDENIADNSGLKISFLAYSNWLKRNEKELPLPALNFTANQMFWLTYAQNWCSYVRSDVLKDSLNEVYAPNNFRVIGTLSNVEEFSKDFNCTVGSQMNPKKKCPVW